MRFWIGLLVCLLMVACGDSESSSDVSEKGDEKEPVIEFNTSALNSAEGVVIGQVTLKVVDGPDEDYKSIVISCGKTETKLSYYVAGVSAVLGVVDDYKLKFDGGYGEEEFSSEHVTFLPRNEFEQLKAEDFARFSFFGKGKTTIGLVCGDASGTSGGNLSLLLIDVTTGACGKFSLGAFRTPLWIEQKDLPPTFVEEDCSFLGSRISPFGFAYRTTAFWEFKDGAYQANSEKLTTYALEQYQNSKLSDAEFKLLGAKSWYSDESDDLIVKKFLDLQHYSEFCGKKKEFDRLMKKYLPNGIDTSDWMKQ